MTFEQVDSIAQGRVWTGSEALQIGLVDEIGGLNDALKHAAGLVKIKEYKTKNFPEYEKDFADIFSNLGLPFMQSKESFIKAEVGEENYKLIEQIRKVQTRRGVQVILPYELNIH